MITGVFIRYSDLIIIFFFIINEHPAFIVFTVRIVPYRKDEFNNKLKVVVLISINAAMNNYFRQSTNHLQVSHSGHLRDNQY